MYSKEERILAKNECCNHLVSKCLITPSAPCKLDKADNKEKCGYFERAVKPLLLTKHSR